MAKKKAAKKTAKKKAAKKTAKKKSPKSAKKGPIREFVAEIVEGVKKRVAKRKAAPQGKDREEEVSVRRPNVCCPHPVAGLFSRAWCVGIEDDSSDPRVCDRGTCAGWQPRRMVLRPWRDRPRAAGFCADG